MTLTPEDLSRQIKQGPSARLDWLPDSASAKALAPLIAAMANGGGGLLILGVAGPNGVLVGVRDPLAAEDKMLQAMLLVEPRLLIPVPRTVRLADRSVVTLEIRPASLTSTRSTVATSLGPAPTPSRSAHATSAVYSSSAAKSRSRLRSRPAQRSMILTGKRQRCMPHGSARWAATAPRRPCCSAAA